MIGSSKGRAGLTLRPGSRTQCFMHFFWTGGSPSTPRTQAVWSRSSPHCYSAGMQQHSHGKALWWFNVLYPYSHSPFPLYSIAAVTFRKGHNFFGVLCKDLKAHCYLGTYVLPVGLGPGLHTRQAHVLQLFQDEDRSREKQKRRKTVQADSELIGKSDLVDSVSSELAPPLPRIWLVRSRGHKTPWPPPKC